MHTKICPQGKVGRPLSISLWIYVLILPVYARKKKRSPNNASPADGYDIGRWDIFQAVLWGNGPHLPPASQSPLPVTNHSSFPCQFFGRHFGGSGCAISPPHPFHHFFGTIRWCLSCFTFQCALSPHSPPPCVYPLFNSLFFPHAIELHILFHVHQCWSLISFLFQHENELPWFSMPTDRGWVHVRISEVKLSGTLI